MEAFKKDVDAYLRELKKVLPSLRDKTRITFAWSASTLDKNCMLVDFQFRRSALSDKRSLSALPDKRSLSASASASASRSASRSALPDKPASLVIRDIKNTRCMAGRTDLLEVFLKKMDAFARRNDMVIRRK